MGSIEAAQALSGAATADVKPQLTVRLAKSPAEIDAAQALRYRVFYEEWAANATNGQDLLKRDADQFDDRCDHLLVIDSALGDGPEAVVGTYRLMRRSVADKTGGFYSAGEYDIAPILAVEGELLELGRSCVDPAYRTRSTLQLLWQGIAAYVFENDIALLFGCASFPGVDPDAIAAQLSYLHQNHLAPEHLRARALPALYTDMDRLPADQIDVRRTVAAMPPLIKGYLRLGAWVGDGAVIDRDFQTIDAMVIVKTDQVTDRYYDHYQRASGRVTLR